ncbi:MAG: hypothetical protein Q4G67_01430 [Actinomycetia bacterium]|nr:hypothetical protein [Actinomycetes bacterium]
MITLLRRLLGVVLILVGAAALIVGGWFARALGTEGNATFTTTPPAGMPLVITPETNARTDLPLLITATADDATPIMLSIAPPSDAEALLADSRHVRVSGIDVREWELLTDTQGTGDPVTPATADLWRSQGTSEGSVSIEGNLETAPEYLILTTSDDEPITELSMTWSNPAWFYQALSLVFAGLLTALVGLALLLRRSAPRRGEEAAEQRATEQRTADQRSAEQSAAEKRDATTTAPVAAAAATGATALEASEEPVADDTKAPDTVEAPDAQTPATDASTDPTDPHATEVAP